MTTHRLQLSIVLPAKNEAQSLGALLGQITKLHPTAELLVVDDGSADEAGAVGAKPVGQSHIRPIRPIRDGIRFLLIIFKVDTLYSPLKIFLPIAAIQVLIGLMHYTNTYLSTGRLTLGTIFMISSGLTIFLIGLVSEQITHLMYRGTSGSEDAR